MPRRVVIAAVILLSPALVCAASYFEFAPDYSEPLTVQPGMTVSQKFAPLNDRLSAVEVWVSTGGVTANIDVTLRNPAGTVLAVRTVPLGGIADDADGTRTTITFPSQLTVTGSDLYTLDITPVNTPLKLYRSTSVSIAPGSGGDSSASYRYGRAVVGGVEQGYSFKFALTESAETTLPAVIDARIVQPTIGQAMMSFRTSEPVDVQVVYGSRTTPWTGEFSTCLPGIIECNVYLSVVPGVTYPYTATLKDVWGNTVTTRGEFTAIGQGPGASPAPSATGTASPTPTSSPAATGTPVIIDSTPPAIINPRLVSITPTSATVAWTTDEPADSAVVITGEGIYRYDDTRELEHFMTIEGLLPDHYYRMRVSSTDFVGNYSDVLIIFVTPLTLTPTPSAGGLPSGSATPTPSPTPSFTVVVPTTQLPPVTDESPSPTSSVAGSPSDTPIASATASGPPSATPSATTTPSVVAYPSTSVAPGEIRWPPAGGDYDGYRIDIFDEFGNLITTLTAGKDATSLQLPAGIGNGSRVIVYADRSSAFEKVGSTFVTDRPLETTGTSYATSIAIIGGGVIFLAGLIYAWIRERRKQKVVITADTSIGLGGGSQAGR